MFGSIEIKGTDQDYAAMVDRLAVDEGQRMMFASMIADAGIIKGIRATLNCDKKSTLVVSGVEVRTPKGGVATQGTIAKTECGYTTHLHRLGCNQVHAFFVSKWPGVLLTTADDHLWARLNKTDFTTPMLESWLPHIKREMIRLKHLQPLYCFNCEVGLLSCTIKSLDAIVSEGIRNGNLIIPERKTA